MSGTPLDLTPLGDLFAAIGWLYWLIAFALVVLALWLPKLLWQKLAATAIAITAVYFVFVRPVQMRLQTQQQERQESIAKLEESMVLFKKRCDSAGERISRTVENVEGVVWTKWRESSDKTHELYGDQFKLFDPYGRDCGAEECIARLLRVTVGAALNPEEARRHGIGYRFIETIDPNDGQRYRYRGVVKLRPIWTPEAIAREKKLTGKDIGPSDHYFSIERQSIDNWSTKYGIAWEDISTREDRDHWIAGGAIRVIDLETGQPIAERIGYLIDPGQGSKGRSRSPWGWAKSYAPRCPPKDESTHDFVVRVLKPATQGE